MKNLKVLSIGDIHGRDSWKFITHGSPYEFEQWCTIVGAWAEGDPNSMFIGNDIFFKDYPYYQYDKIVFIGDYVDSFTLSNVVIKKNLEDIIYFKKILGDKVILLWGNHDVQYLLPGHTCSGYRPEARYDLGDLFRNNKELFQLSFQIEKYLWTHAGLTKPILKLLKNYEFLKDLKTESEILNTAFDYEVPEIFQVDRISGGIHKNAGPLWIRPNQLKDDGVNLNQIVGHTPQKSLLTLETSRLFKIWVIDYLEYGNDNEINPFVLDL